LNPADGQALREMVGKLETAWNESDTTGWPKLFAEDVDFINILGVHYSGRTTIEAGHRVIFGTIYKGSRNKDAIERIRPIGHDEAVVFILAELEFYDNGVARHLKARPALTVQRAGDAWQIAAFQNTLVAQEISDADRRSAVERRPSEAADPAAGGNL
jgi:uncharacterized protein (TIGR02246 family)